MPRNPVSIHGNQNLEVQVHHLDGSMGLLLPVAILDESGSEPPGRAGRTPQSCRWSARTTFSRGGLGGCSSWPGWHLEPYRAHLPEPKGENQLNQYYLNSAYQPHSCSEKADVLFVS